MRSTTSSTTGAIENGSCRAARPVTPPPHGLSRGNVALSSSRTLAPAVARWYAAVEPAGPPPTIATSWDAISRTLRDDACMEGPQRHDPQPDRAAGAIRAEEPEELARSHLEIEPVDGDERPVRLAQLLGADRRVPHIENVSAAAGLQCAAPGVCPSGQRERAVNPSAQPTEVRILPPPSPARE